MERLWVEKYRPKKIKGIVGNEVLKTKFQKFIDDGEIPNILLYGSAGTGKTTISKILLKSLDCEYLYVDGSNDTGVNVMREKIGTFCGSVGFASLKIVFIDEADYLSLASQACLRRLIEDSSDTTRFIFACNYPEKFIDAVLSRFQMFEVKPPKIEDLIERAYLILRKENITEYNDDDVQDLVKNCYPDLRKMIHTLQMNCIGSKLDLSVGGVFSETYKSELIKMLKNKCSFESIRQFVNDQSGIDYEIMYKILYDSIDEYVTNSSKRLQIRLYIGDYLYRHSIILDKEINFMCLIDKILATI